MPRSEGKYKEVCMWRLTSKLGLFYYKAEGVVASIVKVAKEDGVTVQMGFDAVGQFQSCLEILKELKGEGPAKLASTVPLSEVSPKMEGVEVKFVAPPGDEKERTEFFHFVFAVWLEEKLETGEFVPSPRFRWMREAWMRRTRRWMS